MRNLPLKLLSLIIAFLLFLFAHSQTNSSVISLVVPVEVLNVPTSKVILLPDIRQAQVSFKGPSFLVREVAMSAPSFRVSLPKEPSSRELINLGEQELALPPGVQIVSIEPPELELFLDDLVKRDVKVEVPRIGKLASDVQLQSIKTEPERISITGSQTELRALKSIQTMPLDLRDISESTSRILKIRNVGKFSKTSVEVVKVNINVRVQKSEKFFKGLAVKIVSDDQKDVSILPATVSVEVSGKKSVVEKILKNELLPYVSFDESKPEGTYKVQIDLPEGLELIMIKPEFVEIRKIKRMNK